MQRSPSILAQGKFKISKPSQNRSIWLILHCVLPISVSFLLFKAALQRDQPFLFPAVTVLVSR